MSISTLSSLTLEVPRGEVDTTSPDAFAAVAGEPESKDTISDEFASGGGGGMNAGRGYGSGSGGGTEDLGRGGTTLGVDGADGDDGFIAATILPTGPDTVR
jgi:hypothetical protein